MDLYLLEALELHQEFGESRRQWMQVRRVGVEVRGGTDQVFRVRCLEDDHAAGSEYALALIQQGVELLERQVLDHMERGDRCQAVLRLLGQPQQRVLLHGAQTLLVTGLDIHRVQIDADARVVLRQHLQPFTPAAADVHQWQPVVERHDRIEDRQVIGLATTDGFGVAPETVFEGQVKTVRDVALVLQNSRYRCGSLLRRGDSHLARLALQLLQAGAQLLLHGP